MSQEEYLSQIFKGDKYHEITVDEANMMFESGKSFILVYFSYQCGITLSRIAMFQQLMDEYGIEIYGLNALEEICPEWIWQKFSYPNGQLKIINYPVVCTVVNQRDYTCIDGKGSLREQVVQINDYLLKTGGIQVDDNIWKGFYELNASMKARERTDREALNQYLVSTNLIQSQNWEIVKLSNQIIKGLSDDYDKLRAIHDWVSDNIIYDMYTFRTYLEDDYYGVKDKDYSALGTLQSEVTVCAGYAYLTAALARSAGIPCKVVTGFADGVNSMNTFHDIFKLYKEYLTSGDEEIFQEMNSNHAWNEAFVNGRWVILDTTWDSNNEDRGGIKTMLESDSKYFDIDLEDFSETHAFWKSEFFDPASDYWVEDKTDTEEVIPAPYATAVPTSSKVMLNGESILVDAYGINGNNYFKLRDLAFMLRASNSEKQYEVVWDKATKFIHIITAEVYTPVGGEMETQTLSGSQSAVLNTSPIFFRRSTDLSYCLYHKRK